MYTSAWAFLFGKLQWSSTGAIVTIMSGMWPLKNALRCRKNNMIMRSEKKNVLLSEIGMFVWINGEFVLMVLGERTKPSAFKALSPSYGTLCSHRGWCNCTQECKGCARCTNKIYRGKFIPIRNFTRNLVRFSPSCSDLHYILYELILYKIGS